MSGGGTDPTDPEAAIRRAEVLTDLDRGEDALRLLTSALRATPDDARLWRQIAYTELALSHPEQALEAAHRSLRLEPDHEWAHRLASNALSELGRHPEAIAAARVAVGLAPYSWQCHTRLAMSLTQARSREYLQSWQAATRAVELAPNEPHAHIAVGVVAMARREHAQAEVAFRNALALDPEDGTALHQLAVVELLRGNPGRAAERFRDAVATNPRQQGSADAVDITLLALLSRPAQWGLSGIVPALYSLHAAGSALPRAALAVDAAVVLAAAVRALRGLPPSLRPRVRLLLRQRGIAATAIVTCWLLLPVALGEAVAVWWQPTPVPGVLAVAVWTAAALLLTRSAIRRIDDHPPLWSRLLRRLRPRRG